MFMLTIKWNKKNAVLIIVLAAILLVALIVGISRSSSEPDVSLGIALNSCEKRIAYLAAHGWQADSDSETVQDIVIPREFSEVYEKYNALQIAQGFDLKDYCGMDVKLYTYTIINHPCGEKVTAQLLLFADQVIGGDIHSTALNGFMHGIKQPSE